MVSEFNFRLVLKGVLAAVVVDVFWHTVEVLKLSEVLKERQAAAHLGVVELEVLKLSEVLEGGQAAAHLGVAEVEVLKLSEVLE